MTSSRLIVGLLAATSLAAGAAVAGERGAGQDRSQAAAGATPRATDAAEYGSFGFDVAGMDRSVQPGADFDGFANGAWHRAMQIPADKAGIDYFNILNDKAQQDTRVILEELRRQPNSKSGAAYASYMDEAAVEAKGLTPLKPWMGEIAAVRSKADYAALLGRAARMGVKNPFGSGVTVDSKDPTRYVVAISQSGLALPDRDYYLQDNPAFAKARSDYQAHIARMLTLAGEGDAQARAVRILAFETELAKVHWSRVESRDADKTYNLMTLADFERSAPGVDWTRYFQAVKLSPEQLVVRQPTALTGTAKLIAATDLAVLKDALLIQSLDNYAPYLSKPFVDQRFAFYNTALNGVPQQQDRWKRAVAWTGGVLGEDVGRVYVERHFPPATKAAMDTLVKNVLAAMDRRLQALEWMAPETKVKARAKLAAFTPKIGYPDEWRDYSALQVRADDLMGNVMRAREFEFDRQARRLGGPVNRDEWFMTPMTINAYANPVFNEIVFPAAILQPPYFDPNADPAINYGGIGAVIGHEISHHFDDQGRKYDAQGRLTEWWTPADTQRFTALADKLVQQYNAYEPLPGQKVNGALTLGENIGDLAGLTVAYDAYKASLGGRPAPVLNGFTGDQRFYLGWAQVWRNNIRDAALLQRLRSDPHSPAPQRVQVVRNLDPWYQAFAPKPGQALYLAPTERVRIW